MKKQNNIGKYLAKAAYAMAFVVSLCACTDDNTTTNSYIEEGIPVEIGIKYATPEMTNISTRGLNPSDEKQVNDLYILIFNESGNERKEGSKLYTSDEIKEGKITINTTSGNSRIYAIANVQNNQQQNLQARLDDIKSVTQLEAAYIETALINGVIDVDRTSPNLVMSGAFVAKDVTDKPTGYCPITIEPTQDFTGKGNIELVHFDSHIKFRIRTTEKVTKFEPKTWQVLNVPKQSFLIERAKKNAGTEADYGKSTVYNNQNFLAGKDDNGNNIHTFEFYQFENFKNSKNGIPEAKDREKEVKVSGKNTGEFYYVEPHATYVEFTASMELVEDGVQRIADVRFTVLLGGKDSKDDPYSASNFNTWRNKKYTYDVTINGVDDITTEVGVEDGKPGTETRPGIEGDVIDANGEVRILDAHYNCFNIALTKKQVEDMSILVHTPFDEIEYKANDKRPDGNRDYKWIKFKRRPTSMATDYMQPLAQYGVLGKNVNDDAANGRLDIYSLRNDVIEWANGKDENESLYYTVFVDEYYYEEEPCDGANWGNNSKTYWTNFVNKDPRYIMLVYTPKRSEDKESSWSKAQYFIKQKSIQTYYSTTNLTPDETALGMEHVNESKKEALEIFKLEIDTDNGFLNCSNFFEKENNGTLWKTFGNYKVTTDTRHTNTIEMISSKSHAQCLYRNRDKNGDGIINTNEMEWYLPTFNQISGMYLGATSLPSPLFTPPSTMPADKYYYKDPNYHFATSDGDKLWAQEGCSNNGPGNTMGENPKLTPAYEVRCVRNLGLTAEESKSKAPQKPYSRAKVDPHYVYDMSQMAPANLRTSPSNTLNYHDNFTDTRNKPYRKFELAENFTDKKTYVGEYSWALFNNGKDYCQDYYEGSKTDATRGKGKWRTPNQRELLLIYNTGSGRHDEMVQGYYGMYSCTYWTYGKYNDNVVGGDGYRTFGFHAAGRNLYLDNNGDDNNHANDNYSILRCVRDIIE